MNTATPVKSRETGELHDTQVNIKVVLSGLWVTTLIIFAYVDIFGFFRKDVIEGALAGKIPGPGFAINQTFLMLTTIYILIPSLMVAFCLIAPARVNRVVNIVVAAVYCVTFVGSVAGESWAYFVVGHIVEFILLVGVIRLAWKWPKASVNLNRESEH
jgi:Family of unknown function (DUF6326)